MSPSSGSETQLRPDSFPRLFPEVPEGTPGAGTMMRASRWTPWRCDAVLEIGCPAPHPTASCDDLSIDHGQKHDPRSPGMPLRLDPPPPMTEGVHLIEFALKGLLPNACEVLHTLVGF